MAGLCTITEAKRVLTLDELADAHELLTLREEMERKAMADAKQGRTS